MEISGLNPSQLYPRILILGLYRSRTPRLKEMTRQMDCLLDTNTASNENHVFDFLYIYSGRRPDKTATHADVDFFAKDVIFGSP